MSEAELAPRHSATLASVTNKIPAGPEPVGRKDAALLEAVSRGEYAVNGLRSRDLRRQLWVKAGRAKPERQRAGAVTRPIRLLRAHGVLRKVSGMHRQIVTEGGRKIIPALLAARQADVEQLPAPAACANLLRKERCQEIALRSQNRKRGWVQSKKSPPGIRRSSLRLCVLAQGIPDRFGVPT